MAVAELAILDLRCSCCATHIEGVLRSEQAIARADVNFPKDVVCVEYDDAAIDEARIRDLISERGYRCLAQSEAEPAVPVRRTAAQLGHDAQLAPICCGTKHDRMQYELTHTSADAVHEQVQPGALEEHAGMDHDMSDPKVAHAMEDDMRRRFFLALGLSVPVFLFSPVAVNFFASS
jgi:P-type Cu2+ transporter